MSEQTQCPKCASPNIYADGALWICPECSHEWTPLAADNAAVEAEPGPNVVCDAHGTPLSDGDSVIVIKELKIKGASSSIKVGTKVRNIRVLLDGEDGHDIACKIDGVGALNLKSEFVRKA